MRTLEKNIDIIYWLRRYMKNFRVQNISQIAVNFIIIIYKRQVFKILQYILSMTYLINFSSLLIKQYF